MRVRTLVKLLAAVVFAGVAAVAAVVLTVDPNDYKAEIAQQVRRVTGRELEIGGDVSWRLGMAPAFSIADVRFANAPWGTRAAMLEADRFEIELSLLPLLSGEVRVDRLLIDGADVLAETDPKGQPNWAFGPTESARAPGDGDIVLPNIGNLEIRNARLTFRDGRTEETLVLAVDHVLAQASPSGNRLQLEVAGSWNDIGFTGDGEIGALRTLGGDGDPFPVLLNVAALGISARIDGTIDAPLAGSGIDLGVDLEAADLTALASALGAELRSSGPVKILTKLRGGPDRFVVQDIAVVVGQSDLAGETLLDLSAAAPRIEGALSSRRLDLEELPLPVAPAAATPVPAAPVERVFSDEPLPLEALKRVNGKIDLDFAELITPSLALTDVHVSMLLDNGALAVEPYRAGVAGGRIEGAVSIDTRPATPVVNVTVASRELDIALLLREFVGTDMLEGRASIDLAVQGRGASLAQIMGNLTGHSRLLMGEGRARTEGLDLAVGGLSQAVGGLFSQQGDWTVVNCVANDFAINDGIAVSQVMLVDTTNVTVVGEGDVNLRSEELALKLTPSPKSTTINVSVPVWVRGTLAQPSFLPDKTAGVRKPGGLLGAVVFPPAALLGLGELGAGDNACLQVAAGDGGAVQPAEDAGVVERAGDGVRDAVEGAGEGVRDAVGGVTRGLRNLLGD